MLNKLLFLLFPLFFSSCIDNHENNIRVEYYKSWTGYSHPVKLIDKIDSSQIKNFKVYYVAKYEKNKLLSVTKHLNDTVVYEFKYKYDSTGNFIGRKKAP